MVVLMGAAVGVSYWLGYQDGSRSRPGTVPVITADVMPKPRSETNKPAGRTQKLPMKIPPRDKTAGAYLIDLSKWYNAALTGDWHGNTPDNDLSVLPTGVQKFAGTDFDVRGLIQLRASDSGTASYPRLVTDIQLGLRCRKLHFLHNTLFGRSASPGQVIGAYVLSYADGETVTVPLRIGENILDWYASPDKLSPQGSTVVAWQGTNGQSAKRGLNIHLNKFTWAHCSEMLSSIGRSARRWNPDDSRS